MRRSRWLATACALVAAATVLTPSPPAGATPTATTVRLSPTDGTFLGDGSEFAEFGPLFIDTHEHHVVVATSQGGGAWAVGGRWGGLAELSYSGKVLRRWSPGHLGGYSALGPQNTVYFLGDHNVVVLDLDTLRVIHRYPHPDDVRSIALAAGRIWVVGTENQDGVWSRPIAGPNHWTFTPLRGFLLDTIRSSGATSGFLYSTFEDYPASDPILIKVNGTQLTPLANACGLPVNDNAPEIEPVNNALGAIGAVLLYRGALREEGVRFCHASSQGLTRAGRPVDSEGDAMSVTIAPTGRWIVFTTSFYDAGVTIMRRDGSF